MKTIMIDVVSNGYHLTVNTQSNDGDFNYKTDQYVFKTMSEVTEWLNTQSWVN